MPNFHYDYSEARNYVETNTKLIWDENLIRQVDELFHRRLLTQEQVEAMVSLYIDIVLQLWNPKKYSVLNRIKIAFHFLFGGPLTRG